MKMLSEYISLQIKLIQPRNLKKKAVKRSAPVMKTIKEFVKSIRPVFYSSGQIRIRLKAGEEKTPRIELLNGAVELNELYEDRVK